MKIPLLLSAGLFAAAALAAGGVRNPFWPDGYKGETSPISAEVRVRPKIVKTETKQLSAAEAAAKAKAAAEKAKAEAARAAAAAKAKAEAEARAKAEAEELARRERRKVITRGDWIAARKSLKIGNPAVFTAEDGARRTSINVNGNIYADGDLVSTTFDETRFTWRIQGLGEGNRLRLVRIKAYRLESIAGAAPSHPTSNP